MRALILVSCLALGAIGCGRQIGGGADGGAADLATVDLAAADEAQAAEDLAAGADLAATPDLAPPGRTPVSGKCIRNAGHSCASDGDCRSGGCGGETCYNPKNGDPITTCDCQRPMLSCGCVAGMCTWWQ